MRTGGLMVCRALRAHTPRRGCVDAADAEEYLVAYEGASNNLRQAMANFCEWLANTSPPWAAYRALMTRRLVALDKEPGTRPVGIGSIWLRCISKLLLEEAKQDGKEACGALQLCAGLEAGIEGGLRAALAKVQEQGGFNFADGEIDEAILQGGREEGECASEAGGTEEEDAAAASQHEDGDAPREVLPGRMPK